jgi:hypothetical protein
MIPFATNTASSFALKPNSPGFVFVARGRRRSDFTFTLHGHDHEQCAPDSYNSIGSQRFDLAFIDA